MEIEPVDRISQLPEFVLHDILSLLHPKDAARTSVLSKQWSLIWESYPALDFVQSKYIVFPTVHYNNWSVFTPEIHTFLRCVKNSLTKFRNSKLIGQRFRIVTWNCDLESSSKVNECFDLAIKIGVPEILIHLYSPFAPSSSGLVVPDTLLMPIPLKYHFLKKLSLYGIRLSEEWIDYAVQNCPNIGYLSLHRISGLQRLHISKHDKLSVVSIHGIRDICSVEIVAPKLQEFDFSGEGTTCAIDLSSCRELKKLTLECLEINNEVFCSLISKFPLLEDLTLRYVMLGTILVSGTNLRRVDIAVMDQIEAIEIDAPAMLSYRYEGRMFPPMLFKRVPSQLEIVFVLGGLFPADTSRFVHLREFRASFCQAKVLSVDVDGVLLTFDREKLKGVVVPPSSQLDHLKLEFKWMGASFDMNSLIDGLLWSAHPKRLSVILTPSINSHIKFLCKCLLENEKHDRTCCGSSDDIKCWRHHLKSARIEGFGGDSDWAVFLEDKFISCVEFDEVICFQLEWDDSID